MASAPPTKHRGLFPVSCRCSRCSAAAQVNSKGLLPLPPGSLPGPTGLGTVSGSLPSMHVEDGLLVCRETSCVLSPGPVSGVTDLARLTCRLNTLQGAGSQPTCSDGHGGRQAPDGLQGHSRELTLAGGLTRLCTQFDRSRMHLGVTAPPSPTQILWTAQSTAVTCFYADGRTPPPTACALLDLALCPPSLSAGTARGAEAPLGPSSRGVGGPPGLWA